MNPDAIAEHHITQRTGIAADESLADEADLATEKTLALLLLNGLAVAVGHFDPHSTVCCLDQVALSMI